MAEEQAKMMEHQAKEFSPEGDAFLPDYDLQIQRLQDEEGRLTTFNARNDCCSC